MLVRCTLVKYTLVEYMCLEYTLVEYTLVECTLVGYMFFLSILTLVDFNLTGTRRSRPLLLAGSW